MVSISSGQQTVAPFIPTGNREIDERLGGGIPRRAFTLIDGQSDAGKSVLCQQLLWGALRSGVASVLFSTEYTVSDLVSQMESLGLDTRDHIRQGTLTVFPLRVSWSRWEAVGALRALGAAMPWLPAELFIVDSLTSFVLHATVEDTLAFCQECRALCDAGVTVVTTVHTYALREDALARLRSLSNTHLHLRKEGSGNRRARVLEVGKLSAQEPVAEVIRFQVEPRLGMRVLPPGETRV